MGRGAQLVTRRLGTVPCHLRAVLLNKLFLTLKRDRVNRGLEKLRPVKKGSTLIEIY